MSASRPALSHVCPASGDTVEVYALFRGVMIGARHLALDRPLGDAFVVGSARGVHAPLAADAVPRPAFPLVSAADGAALVEVTTAMTGEVIFEDCRSVSLEAFVHDHGLRFAPPPGASVQIRCGASSFLVRLTSRGVRIPRPRFRWHALHGFLAGTGLVIAMLLAAALCVPASSHAISGETIARATTLLPYLVKPPVPPAPLFVRPSSPGGDAPTAAGPRPVPARFTGAQVIAPARDAASSREEARNAGVLRIFRAMKGAAWEAIFAPTGATLDAAAVLGQVQSVDLAAATSGPGALSTGSHEAGEGERTRGPGGLNTIGGRNPDGSRGSYGLPARLPDRAVRPLHVSTGKPVVRGALDREIVRRVIRRHLNEVKFCYERALVTRPGLAGRLTVQFTISGAGRVVAAIVQESSLADARVESCVRDAVRRWEFPQPQGGGVVLVSYPFVLVPAGDATP